VLPDTELVRVVVTAGTAGTVTTGEAERAMPPRVAGPFIALAPAGDEQFARTRCRCTPPLQVYAAGTVSLAWWGAAEQCRAAASWVQEPVAMRAVLACLLLMLVSVATPQAARGWAHPPCSYFQEPILLMPWVCFRAGGLVAPRELHKVGERSLHAPALHPSTV
jgi:hypothetical protein